MQIRLIRTIQGQRITTRPALIVPIMQRADECWFSCALDLPSGEAQIQIGNSWHTGQLMNEGSHYRFVFFIQTPYRNAQLHHQLSVQASA